MTNRYTPDVERLLDEALDRWKTEQRKHQREITPGIGWHCKCGWKPKPDAKDPWRSATAHLRAVRSHASKVYREEAAAATRRADA